MANLTDNKDRNPSVSFGSNPTGSGNNGVSSAYAQFSNGGNGGTYYGSQDSASPYDTAEQQMAREGNYVDLFSKQVQLEVLRRQAQRNLDATNQANGVYGTGMGSSAMNALNNAYINQQQKNLADYQDTERNLTSEAYQNYISDQAQKDAALISYLQNDGQNANKYLQNAGYMDENGNYTDAWYQLSDDRRTNIQNAMTASGAGTYSTFINNTGAQAFSGDKIFDSGSSDSLYKVAIDYADGSKKGVAADKGGGGVHKALDDFRDHYKSIARPGQLYLLENPDPSKGYMWLMVGDKGQYYVISDAEARSYNGPKYRISGYGNGLTDITGSDNPHSKIQKKKSD